mmetsp:Transcript_44779/g.43374  ORF Transcript_44779/g.43374 Transcript_44779/m.43374 type:complete len:94 (+) Transcript_44779:263-544(+)|eukprot:CAMPEP_0170557082 /NCGR_PEP_ID=MMETSP0211-20121228/19183_1 /TAXON_ID=311385 /ORGANISM="Pseudokeronopsis sp., Strain OXSARD2" /LENGTH=93 /DNA_ID=CAMNT_0010867789 /DNA_START=263 /DNA_END=544 /DNA_ORIENTATION=+
MYQTALRNTLSMKDGIESDDSLNVAPAVPLAKKKLKAKASNSKKPHKCHKGVLKLSTTPSKCEQYHGQRVDRDGKEIKKGVKFHISFKDDVYK